MSDPLEELERKWRTMAKDSQMLMLRRLAFQNCADELAALKQDYALVSRMPSKADLERVGEHIAWKGWEAALDCTWIVDAKNAWEAIVGGTDET